MGIKWTSSAINDIENIREYINKDSEIYSERFIGKIVKAVERLSIFPDMGRKVKETKSDYIRVSNNNYHYISLWKGYDTTRKAPMGNNLILVGFYLGIVGNSAGTPKTFLRYIFDM